VITVTAAALDVWVAAFLYPFLRILALVVSAPLFSHASVPLSLRVGLAIAVTAVVAPTLPAVEFVSPFSATGAVLAIAQVAIGVAIGFVMQVVFATVTLAGDLIGLQMGLSFAGFIDPQRADETPIVGGFLSLALMLVFLGINGHLALVKALVDSFDALPVTVAAWRTLDFARIVASGATMFATGLSLALPVVGALLLVNFTLGMLTRTAPQLNLFAVGFPVTLFAGLLMLLVTMPYAMPALQAALERGLATLRH
jgi:flagellar biosynthetic protein FliR